MNQISSHGPRGAIGPVVVADAPADTVMVEDGPGLLHIDLASIMAMIRRNLIWIIAIIVLALGLGVAATLLMTPRYVAATQVLVETQAEQIIESADSRPTMQMMDAERYLQTQLDIVTSRSLSARVVEVESLADDPAFYEAMDVDMPDEQDLKGRYSGAEGLVRLRTDRATDLLLGSITTELPLDSRLMTIRVETTSPVMSARLANAVSDNYIAANLARKFDSSSYAREFLSQQLDEARQKLGDSERELNSYSRAAGLIRVSNQGPTGDADTTLSVTNESLLRLNQAANEATALRIQAEETWENVSGAPLMSIPQVLENPAMSALIRQRSDSEANLAEEKARHLDDHPTVLAMQAEVDRYDQQINEVGNSIRRSVRTQYQTAVEQEDSLRDRVEQLRSTAMTEQDAGVQYNILNRVAETNRSLYDTLLERYNELNATAGAALNNISMVDRAEIPDRPASPSLPLNLALSLIMGLVAAGGFVFLREHFDDVIRSPEDVERKLNMPLLGLIPRVDNPEALQEAIDDRKSGISEAYHSLVTNLFYATSSGLPKTLMVTSSTASEGKTTTSTLIATYLARLGRSVILVDGDLRRPTLHRRIGKSEQMGLTNVLSGQSTLDEVLVPSGEPNLTYLTALPIPPDPSLLLGGTRLNEIIDELARRYDVVVVDCPPILGLSDAVSWSTKVEGALLVIDSTQGHRGAIKAGQRRLSLVNAPLLGAVLTKFDPQAAGGAYAYYGYNYYAYGDDKQD